jgi:hypothetical protein
VTVNDVGIASTRLERDCTLESRKL